MPAAEGVRLGVPGFGELAVPDGEQIVGNVNRLLSAAALKNCISFTTQDEHPPVTAHFSDQPNFMTTWPRHCVKGTPGAELHPDIWVPVTTVAFKKGGEVLRRGEDDRSYDGSTAVKADGELLYDWLERQHPSKVYLGGLALDYCVGRTAIGLNKRGLNVAVVLDATKGIEAGSIAAMLDEFRHVGIETLSTEEALAQLALVG
jgi:nicotinamidase/pyrazinamidase